MAMSSSEESFPSELKETIGTFHAQLEELDQKVLSPLKDIKAKVKESEDMMSAAEKAKLDLVSCFALNSLSWIYLRTHGVDPQATEVKEELDRVKSCMQRLKEIELKNTKHARVDQAAAKRFVKSSLWTPKTNKREQKFDRNSDSKKRSKK